MTLFVDRGVPEDDRGEPFHFATDPTTGKEVFVYIRPMPRYMQQVQISMQREESLKSMLSEEGFTDAILDRLAWSLRDSKDFPVHLETDDAVEFYSSQLGESFKKGDDVLLDGRWTDEIRKRIVHAFDDLADFVLAKVDEIRLERVKARNRQVQNLSTGSSGKSRRVSRKSRKKGARAAKS